MKTLVLGAAGFIGSKFSESMAENGRDIITSKRSRVGSNELFSLDLNNKNEFEKILAIVDDQKIDLIVNLAATGVTPTARDIDFFEENLFFRNLEETMLARQSLRLLHVGTHRPGDISSPDDPYFVSKQELKKSLMNSYVSDRIVCVDLPKVVGIGEPRGRFTADLIAGILTGKDVNLLHPCRKRNFISLPDAVEYLMDVEASIRSSFRTSPEHQPSLISNYEIAQMISEIAGSDRFRVNLSHSYNRNLCPICPTSEPPLSIKPLNKYMSEASTKRQSIKISVRDSLTQQVAAVQNQNSQSQSQVKEGSDG